MTLEKKDREKPCSGCWTDTSTQLIWSKVGLCRLNSHSPHYFFFLISLICVNHLLHLPLSLILSLCSPQSTSSSLCSGHGPLLSHISSHNSSGKTSLNLTLHMWVHTAKSSNNTEILQIRSCQINRGISGAHPSLWRGQLEACSRPDLHVKTQWMIHTVF